MTLGKRVAVMRDGKVQQVDAPQRLYDEPTNLFVAAFIGSPSMNLVHGSVGASGVRLGQFEVPLAPGPPAPRLDEPTIVGVRPEAFEDDDFAPPDLPRIEATVRVLEELGSDAYVFTYVQADAVVVEDAQSTEEDEDATLFTQRDAALFAARVDPRTKAQVGQRIRLAIDASRFYFFSPETGESLNGRSARTAG